MNGLFTPFPPINPLRYTHYNAPPRHNGDDAAAAAHDQGQAHAPPRYPPPHPPHCKSAAATQYYIHSP